MQPYFRDAVGSDLPAIAAILRGRDPGDPPPNPGLLRDALAEIDRTHGSYVLVAEFDRQIVALLHLVVHRHLHDGAGRTARIVRLAVAPEFRTSGVNGMLIDHAAARAHDLGCRRLEAGAATSANDAHHTWERAGFVHLDRGYVRSV